MGARRTTSALVVLLGLLAPLLAVVAAPAPASADAWFSREVYGRSVDGRPLVAFHLASPEVATRRETVVLFSTMHGNEPDTRHALRALVDGPQVIGLDLWVVPVYNPDGLAAGTRRNARGVDLNRNFPHAWADLDGSYESGRGPASEPETRATMRFLRRVDPDWVLSFHQPLLGVDTDTKRPAFARRVARTLGLPTRTLDCGGTCHGTMTGWFNAHFDGAALTVEYGARPSRRHLTRTVPDLVLRVFGAGRGQVGADRAGF
ncbi:M14 family zinc carboxypeptidase [Nocardioides litoris]|uniref:M14 family zinc carboxypeptidase n=1 Tax=Nocardioides litoris TaxID=1926648 RepID=UPI00111D5D87|nr:M14 family zinc carboxypeptidase [Nocardioides litoris]